MKLMALGGVVYLGSCAPARTILRQAPMTADETDIRPVSSWREPDVIRALYEDMVYGPVPEDASVEILSSQVLDDNVFNGKAVLHQWRMRIGYGAATRPLDLVAILPKDNPDAPLILSQNFCPNPSVIPLDGVSEAGESNFCEGNGILQAIMTSTFGRYIVTPPMEDVLDRGYGLAAVYPAQLIPDSGEPGLRVLAELFPDEQTRPGALAVWAGLYPIMGDVIGSEYGDRPLIAYGHSRFGKTALVAGAWFDSIDAVVAHQSGTLGASDFKNGVGEPLESLVGGFPHWPSLTLAEVADQPDSLPVSTAEFLHLMEDKPVLIGNARRDTWADPYGAFTAAKAAFPDTMSAQDPKDFIPTDRHAYWIRPGTHGIVKEDWPAFLDFLDGNIVAIKENWRPREDLNPQPAD